LREQRPGLGGDAALTHWETPCCELIWAQSFATYPELFRMIPDMSASVRHIGNTMKNAGQKVTGPVDGKQL
jgi:hypothetical protein